MITNTPDYTNPQSPDYNPYAPPRQGQNQSPPNPAQGMMPPPPPPSWTQTQKDSTQERLILRLKNLKKSVAVVSPSERDALGGAGQQFGVPSISKEAFVLKVTSLLSPTVYIEQSTQGEMKFYCDIKTAKDIDKLLDTILAAKPDAKSITLPEKTLEVLKNIKNKDGTTLLEDFRKKVADKFPASTNLQLYAENESNPIIRPDELAGYLTNGPNPPPQQSTATASPPMQPPQQGPIPSGERPGQMRYNPTSNPPSLGQYPRETPSQQPQAQMREQQAQREQASQSERPQSWQTGISSSMEDSQRRVDDISQRMQPRPGETPEAHADRISQERRSDLQRHGDELQREASATRPPSL